VARLFHCEQAESLFLGHRPDRFQVLPENKWTSSPPCLSRVDASSPFGIQQRVARISPLCLDRRHAGRVLFLCFYGHRRLLFRTGPHFCRARPLSALLDPLPASDHLSSLSFPVNFISLRLPDWFFFWFYDDSFLLGPSRIVAVFSMRGYSPSFFFTPPLNRGRWRIFFPAFSPVSRIHPSCRKTSALPVYLPFFSLGADNSGLRAYPVMFSVVFPVSLCAFCPRNGRLCAHRLLPGDPVPRDRFLAKPPCFARDPFEITAVLSSGLVLFAGSRPEKRNLFPILTGFSSSAPGVF